MAKRIESFEFRKTRGKYPWREWFDGGYWCLMQGVDFQCGRLNFKSAVHMAAHRMGLSVRTEMVREREIVIQAKPNGT